MNRSIYTVVAAVISVAAGVVAAQMNAWLVVVAIAAGWLRWFHILVQLHLVLFPKQLAETALDDGWRDPGWDEAELAIRNELLTLAEGNWKRLRRAIPYVGRLTKDVGRRRVAIDRLETEIAHLRREPQRMSARRRLLSTVGPTSWAMGTGSSALVIFAETTPGPVLGQPWRIIAGLAAAGATSSLMTMAKSGGGNAR